MKAMQVVHACMLSYIIVYACIQSHAQYDKHRHTGGYLDAQRAAGADDVRLVGRAAGGDLSRVVENKS